MKNHTFEAKFPIIKSVVKEDMKSKTEANLSLPNYDFTYDQINENMNSEEITERMKKIVNTSPKNVFRLLMKETAKQIYLVQK